MRGISGRLENIEKATQLIQERQQNMENSIVELAAKVTGKPKVGEDDFDLFRLKVNVNLQNFLLPV